MRICAKCERPMSTESFQTGDGDYLGYFCSNPCCEDYDCPGGVRVGGVLMDPDEVPMAVDL